MFQIKPVLIVIIVATIAGLWKIFEKAGEKGWKALIPVYNYYVWLKIIRRPWWWLLILLIPGVGFMMLMAVSGITASRFPRNRKVDIGVALITLLFEAALLFYIIPESGVSKWTGMMLYAATLYLIYLTGKPFLAMLSNKNAKTTMHPALVMIVSGVLFFIFLPWLAFSKEQWSGENAGAGLTPSLKDKKPQHSPAHEWTEAIVFAVIAATIIRTFIVEAYTIPTPSMEKSLMVGDYLFVSKVNYGARIPITPIAFPFAHNSLGGTVNSYLEWLEFPCIRIPGFAKIKRHDVVVFNFPEGDTVCSNVENPSYYEMVRDYGRDAIVNNKQLIQTETGDQYPGSIIVRPLDREENYIKRCIAVAGDTITIRHSDVYINGKKDLLPEESQFTYEVVSKGEPLSSSLCSKLDITDIRELDLSKPPDYYVYALSMTKKTSEALKGYGYTPYPMVNDSGRRDMSIFPFSKTYAWNVDNFGPLYIPKEGVPVKLDTGNLPIYRRLISVYEGNKLEVKGANIFINDKPANSYTFKMNYYFMMGDNRHNSEDSRYWGFVPGDHIVGKGSFIWMSLKKDEPITKKPRWNRFFTFVNSEGLSKSYLVHGLLIILLAMGYFYFQSKRREKKKA